MTKKWDEHMAIIMRLYKEQNIPLHEVQTIMEQKHNFKASTRAYRSRFEKWGIHKYNCRRKGSSDGQVHALPAAPLEGGESTAAVTPPVSPGNSDQPGTRSGPSNGPFCGLESQIYPISPVSVDDDVGRGMPVEQSRATSPAGTLTTMSQCYQGGDQTADFSQQVQLQGYYSPFEQFQPHSSDPYHQQQQQQQVIPLQDNPYYSTSLANLVRPGCGLWESNPPPLLLTSNSGRVKAP